MLVNLSSFTVFPQQPTQYTLPAHPLHLRWHTCLRRTLPLTRTGVTTLALRSKEVASACAGVDRSRLDDNTGVFNQLLDVCPRVGVPNLRLLGGIEPDFALADTSDRGGEPLLRTKVDHGGCKEERIRCQSERNNEQNFSIPCS